ncbi:hypothetical protein ON010_g10505 [Phytophthora cinnamomi]|nr:hypothetical protein ON010_g10505 [Phytophthora cinnamomi]
MAERVRAVREWQEHRDEWDPTEGGRRLAVKNATLICLRHYVYDCLQRERDKDQEQGAGYDEEKEATKEEKEDGGEGDRQREYRGGAQEEAIKMQEGRDCYGDMSAAMDARVFAVEVKHLVGSTSCARTCGEKVSECLAEQPRLADDDVAVRIKGVDVGNTHFSRYGEAASTNLVTAYGEISSFLGATAPRSQTSEQQLQLEELEWLAKRRTEEESQKRKEDETRAEYLLGVQRSLREAIIISVTEDQNAQDPLKLVTRLGRLQIFSTKITIQLEMVAKFALSRNHSTTIACLMGMHLAVT